MSDAPALVTFTEGWKDTNKVGSDGLPLYEEGVLITIERPPLLKLKRPATDQDFLDHKDEYEEFKLIRKAKKNSGEDGYPLVYWPAATAAEIQMLAVRSVTTVEQLARLAGNRDMPGQLADLALRAERMLDMQKNFGKYEAILQEKTDEIDVLLGQVNDLKVSLSAANALIETLKLRAA